MLFWALLASGQITMRKVDGWQSLSEPLETWFRLTSLPDPSNHQPALYQPAERLTHAGTGGPLMGYGLAPYPVCQCQGELV